MSELKWRSGPVPKRGTYLYREHSVSFPSFTTLFPEDKEEDGEWIPYEEIKGLPVEEPPQPPLAPIYISCDGECDDGFDLLAEMHDEYLLRTFELYIVRSCLDQGHTVTLKQGKNEIQLRAPVKKR